MNIQINSNFVQQAWRTDDLFPSIDSPEISTALARVDTLLGEFATWQPLLGVDLSQKDFLAIVTAYENIKQEIDCLVEYAWLKFVADTQDEAAQNHLSQMQQMEANSRAQILFFELWWQQAKEETAVSLMEAAPDYRYWLETLRHKKPYMLSEVEEHIINLKNTYGRKAMYQLYESITNRYVFNLVIDGEEKTLTRGELMTFYYSPEPELRKAAYQEINRVYKNDTSILGQIYQVMARDWYSENVDIRQHSSPISRRYLIDDLPAAVVETLLDVLRTNAPLFHRYFALKANRLGMAKLLRYDLFAPIHHTEQTFSFSDAATLVLESFKEFDPQFAQKARFIFEAEHYDGEVRPGKSPMALCCSITPKLTPWIQQSFHGKPYDLAIMAHELGHAVHAILASDNNALIWAATLPLAETASTFGEMLLVDYLVDQYPDPEIQQSILFQQMDEAYATIMRQGYFFLFEMAAHDAIQEKATTEDLCDLYLANLKEQFGEVVEISDDFRYEWLAIPHFFFDNPFYVYSYTFGQLLSLSLYEQYKTEGKSFIDRFLNLLAAGGSASPSDLLEKGGIDMSAAEFWQGGFDVLAGLLERLETIEVDLTPA